MSNNPATPPKPSEGQPQESIADYREREFLRAVAKVETNGNIRRGDNGKAWGKYQMHAVFVRDVNELLGTEYEHADAEHPVLGEQLARDAYRAYYNYLSGRGIDPTPERLAYIWNGGRSAHKYLDDEWFNGRQGSVDEKTRIAMGSKRSNLQRYGSKVMAEFNPMTDIPITPDSEMPQENQADKLFENAPLVGTELVDDYDALKQSVAALSEQLQRLPDLANKISNSQRDDAASKESPSELK